MNRLFIHLIALILLPACAFIVGQESPAPSDEVWPSNLIFVESLRNEASLRGEGMKEAQDAPSAADSLIRPVAVYADDFRVYVADSYLHKPLQDLPGARIFVFDRGNRKVSILDSREKVKLLSPAGIAVDPANIIFVSDAQQGRVLGYDLNGNPIIELGKAGDLASPSGLAIDRFRNRLYVADPNSRRVRVFDALGKFLFDIDGSEPKATALRFPFAVSIDRKGNVYILDSRERVVSIYNPDRGFLRGFRIMEPAGASIRSGGIAVDSDGNIYITDMLNNRVLIFSNEGRFRRSWGRGGTLFGDFWTPAGIFIDGRDYIYIADQTNGRVQVFRYTK